MAATTVASSTRGPIAASASTSTSGHSCQNLAPIGLNPRSRRRAARAPVPFGALAHDAASSRMTRVLAPQRLQAWWEADSKWSSRPRPIVVIATYGSGRLSVAARHSEQMKPGLAPRKSAIFRRNTLGDTASAADTSAALAAAQPGKGPRSTGRNRRVIHSHPQGYQHGKILLAA